MIDLKISAEKLVNDFQSLDIYQKYVKVKAIYFSSEVYHKLQKLENDKKAAKNLVPSKRKEFLAKIKDEINFLEESPIYINYHSLKEELLELLSPLRETKF